MAPKSPWEEEESPVPVTSGPHMNFEEVDRQCHHCRSHSLVTDWAAGDRICTNCGVVGEERIPDDRPEWREFNDADDLAKGLPAAARCGMVPVDETRYLGGLQPTTLSLHVYGGGSCAIRKRLFATNRKLDFMMQKQHARALTTAKLSRQARKRLLTVEDDSWEEVDSVRPDYDRLLLQEEEQAQRTKDALYAEKWSINRAILLHGQGEESSTHGPLHYGEEGREELLQQLDAPLQKAAADLYQAYTMLQAASQKLHLPDRVLHEATAMMCRYATSRDGITVKGVSSRISPTNKDSSTLDKKEAAERLREYNRQKQAGALGSALLYLTARKLGWERSPVEVCSSFQPQDGLKGADTFIKPKHCYCAMNEVRAVFPHYHGHSTGNLNDDHAVSATDSIGNFVEHATRKLELPPVAVASIRTLVQQYRREQIESETKSMTKLSTICASISLFVCLAGASLQRLAQQAQNSESITFKRQRPLGFDNDERSSKRTRLEEEVVPFDEGSATVPGTPKDVFVPSSEEPGTQAFDAFSHSPNEDPLSEKKQYEMRRIWDAWSEQMPWFRSIARIEQSCGVSRNAVLSFYKAKIFPRRHALLDVLQVGASNSKDANDSMLKDTPLASVLLKKITAAAPLMSSKGEL